MTNTGFNQLDVMINNPSVVLRQECQTLLGQIINPKLSKVKKRLLTAEKEKIHPTRRVFHPHTTMPDQFN